MGKKHLNKEFYHKTELEICSTNKPCYDKRTAETVKNSRRKEGAQLRIYQCGICNHWHVTSQDRSRYEE